MQCVSAFTCSPDFCRTLFWSVFSVCRVSMMNVEIDAEMLISLVEARPMLWDKTLESYKDRGTTKCAWLEICRQLNSDFEDMNSEEKEVFSRMIIRKWCNIRDSYVKSEKKLKQTVKTGSGVYKQKKYVFNKQLRFLHKLYSEQQAENNADSGLEVSQCETDEKSDNSQSIFEINEKTTPKVESTSAASDVRIRKRSKPNEAEPTALKPARDYEQANRHMCFFQGIIPSLEKFSEDEVIQFQMGVLQLISSMAQKKKRRSF